MEFSKNPLESWLDRFSKYVRNNLKVFLLSILLALGLISLITGYFFYKNILQERAHKSLVSAVKYFDAPVVKDALESQKLNLDSTFFATDKEKWTKVEQVFDSAYQDNKRSDIAPIFLAYKSEALLNLGKQKEAISVLKDVVRLIPDSAAKFYYELKLALVKIDTREKALVDQGIATLERIAMDKRNYADDMALYRLGEYYYFNKNFSETKNYWNQLTLKYGKTSNKSSWPVIIEFA